jgi:hypothetical protein
LLPLKSADLGRFGQISRLIKTAKTHPSKKSILFFCLFVFGLTATLTPKAQKTAFFPNEILLDCITHTVKKDNRIEMSVMSSEVNLCNLRFSLFFSHPLVEEMEESLSVKCDVCVLSGTVYTFCDQFFGKN